MNMKTTMMKMVGVIGVMVVGLQAEVVTFTNRAGRVWEQVTVTHVLPHLIYFKATNGMGGSVLLADLPGDLQRLFKYDAGKAAEYQSAEKAKNQRAVRNTELERMAFYKAKADRERFEQEKREFLDSKVEITGKVIQRWKDGMLLVLCESIKNPSPMESSQVVTNRQGVKEQRGVCVIADKTNDLYWNDEWTLHFTGYMGQTMRYTSRDGFERLVTKYVTEIPERFVVKDKR
jgi:hypothetical protein